MVGLPSSPDTCPATMLPDKLLPTTLTALVRLREGELNVIVFERLFWVHVCSIEPNNINVSSTIMRSTKYSTDQVGLWVSAGFWVIGFPKRAR